MNDLDIFHLGTPTDVVGFSETTAFKNADQGIAMVNNIEPVTYILAVSIDWKRFLFHDIQNHQRNELFGELIWPVIIGAIGDQGRQPVCPEIGPNKNGLKRLLRPNRGSTDHKASFP